MKINVKWLLYLPIIFFFLPAFVFWVPFLKTTCQFFYMSLYLCIVFLLFIKPVRFVNKFLKLYQQKPFRYFVWLILLIILNSIFLSLLGIGLLSHSIKAIISQIFLLVIPTIIYFIYVVDDYISVKNFISLYAKLFYIMLFLGFIAYIGNCFNIQSILSIFEFLANDRLIYTQNIGMNMQTSNYMSYGAYRASCVFDEPGHYAQFLYLNLPFIYLLPSFNFKIMHNKYLNFLLKTTTIPLTLLSIVLTMSPIFLVLTLIFSFIFYYKKILLCFDKLIFFIIIFSISLVVCCYVDISNTFLYRIINVFTNIKSYDDFNNLEPSLATRVGTFINSICVFFKYPITGVGYGNLAYMLIAQYDNSPVPLTPEVIQKTAFLSATKNIAFCGKGLYTFIAENGSFICFYTLYLLKSSINKLFLHIKYCKKLHNIQDCIISKILLYEIICFGLCAFYNLSFISKDTCLLLALCIVFLCKQKSNTLIIRKGYV